ncbi:hypothetical protein EYF80_044203 [Liparis tanakae]|uniref:Uncharacterized protein n=1 Tax=Liparis tanakae TaxID=230148 RepID=A0A4Z2FWI7_9TELE|nr:hypothetical protein EYF80_044203 [Liparis tanakae]
MARVSSRRFPQATTARCMTSSTRLCLATGSFARAPTPPAAGIFFFLNFAGTTRAGSGGDREDSPSSTTTTAAAAAAAASSFPSSPTTSSRSGSSAAALPPKKYKSRKTPKHTAITTTLQWIRMARATCCGWKRQTGPRSCLRAAERSGPG